MAVSSAELDLIEAHPDWLEQARQLSLSDTTMLADLTELNKLCGDASRAVVEMTTASRRAEGKLPDHWWLTSDAAQQATPYAVAELRAQRIHQSNPSAVHDVTCSIGTEVSALSSAGLTVIGTDLDLPRVRMARHNAPGGHYMVADALSPATSLHDAIIVADPARRSGGRRIAKPEDLLPPLPDLIDVWEGHEMAIKCAPGLDFTDWDGEVALASVNGGVKEACLYTKGLAQDGVTRSAWVLKGAGVGLAGYSVDHYHDAMNDECAVAAAGRYIIDPDGAVVRAGLVRHFAAAHGLWQLDEHIAHVTGDELPVGIAGFEVIEQVGLKQVRKALSAMDCGAAEILIRGVDASPDVLRKQWKLKGSRHLAVVVTRIGKKAVAFICHPRRIGV